MKFKRILSAAVAAAIALPLIGGSLNVLDNSGSFEMAASAADTLEGEGTFRKPYLIGDAADWKLFQKNIAGGKDAYAFYKLTDDLSLTSLSDPMVGSAEHPFMGYFDGAHKKIHYAIDSTDKAVSLFGCINHATLQNMRVVGGVDGTTHTAGLVVSSSGSRNIIENCYVETTVKYYDYNGSGNQHLGGILGHAGNSEVLLENCVFAGSITNRNSFSGGIVGWCDGGAKVTIQNCLFAGGCSGVGKGSEFHPAIMTHKQAAPNVTLRIDDFYSTMNVWINEGYPDIVPKDKVVKVTNNPVQSEDRLYLAHRITHPYDLYFNDEGKETTKELMETDREFKVITPTLRADFNSDNFSGPVILVSSNDDQYNYKAYEEASVRYVSYDASGNPIDGDLPSKFTYTGDSLTNTILSGIRLHTEGSGDIPYQAVDFEIIRTDMDNAEVYDIKYPGSYAIKFTGKGEPDVGINYTIGSYTYNFKVENTNKLSVPSPEQLFEEVLTYGGAIKLEKDYAVHYTQVLGVPKDVKVYIDLNGHNIDLSLSDAGGSDGASLNIEGTLTVNDTKGGGCIGGNSSGYGRGISISNGGTFNLEGGSVVHNSNIYGGGVYVSGGGTFNMSGGSINNNHSIKEGSGVYIAYGGKFSMNGGTITKNTSDSGKGAVYFEDEDSVIDISGDVNITDNGIDLTNFGLINITGKLSDKARIGISSTAYGKALTKNLSGNGSADNFISSDTEQELAVAKNELYVYEKGTAPVAVTTPAVTTEITTTTTTTEATTSETKKTTAASKTTKTTTTASEIESTTTKTEVTAAEETSRTSKTAKTTKTSETAAESETTVSYTTVSTTSSEPVTETTTAPDIDPDDIMYGDVDLDNHVDLADITRLAKFLLNRISYPLGNGTEATYRKAFIAADVNGDGEAGTLDLSKLIEFNLGGITEAELIPKK